MKVKLRFVGTLASSQNPEQELEVKNGTTWGDALRTIFKEFNLGEIKYEEGFSLRAPGYLLLFLNGKQQTPDTKLCEGDEILITPPLVGG